MPKPILCLFCEERFEPSRFHPNQKICSSDACQRRRRREYHRQKLKNDPDYFQQCRDSQRNWREKSQPQLRHYRQKRRQSLQQAEIENEQALKKRLSNLLKSSGAFDLRQYELEIWLISPDAANGIKNIFARAKALILEADPKVFSPR